MLTNDGWPLEVREAPTLFVIQSSPVPGQGIRALFRPAPPITELDGWREFVVPVHTIGALPLPGNEHGFWEFVPAQPDPVAAWNELMGNVQAVHFPADFASSPMQTEDFAFDNFCLGQCLGSVSVEASTWGRIKTSYRD